MADPFFFYCAKYLRQYWLLGTATSRTWSEYFTTLLSASRWMTYCEAKKALFCLVCVILNHNEYTFLIGVPTNTPFLELTLSYYEESFAIFVWSWEQSSLSRSRVQAICYSTSPCAATVSGYDLCTNIQMDFDYSFWLSCSATMQTTNPTRGIPLLNKTRS